MSKGMPMPGSPTTTRLRLTPRGKSSWIPKEIRGDQGRSVEISGDQGRSAHLRVGSQVGRLDGRSHSACKPSRLWVRPPPSPPTAGSGSNGAIKSSQGRSRQVKSRQEAIRSRWSDQGPSGVIRGPQSALRVHSVVIRGDQTCSRKQIMSSQSGVVSGHHRSS